MDYKEVITIADIKENVYLPIKVTKPLGTGRKSVVWNWEIKIADDSSDNYYGTAKDSSREVVIPWTKLNNLEKTPLEQMKELCMENTEFK
ncbi:MULTISPECIES: hypothetical protein [Bacillus cereus group]|uniref:hypothetical protein n=1 Tax=Bacillus cereus group TaxID=86661 RepID=UPI0008FE9758|nr:MULTISPECIES: hypothetical protein [Bacillus cereus group]OJD90648.1 hypothetical protein MCCC1A01412_13955 [Bacillus anthracis]OPA38146.1 hypothetical protein BHL07_18985 [Bacillus cereus]